MGWTGEAGGMAKVEMVARALGLYDEGAGRGG